jgi:hypothetical protein
LVDELSSARSTAIFPQRLPSLALLAQIWTPKALKKP